MFKKATTPTLLLVLTIAQTSVFAVSESIHLNQLGYYPTSPKRVIVTTGQVAATEFKVINDKTGETVISESLSVSRYWDSADESARVGDFSSLNDPGTYHVEVNGIGESYSFEIRDNLYREALVAAARSFFYQRASMDLEEKHAGEYARIAGHMNSATPFHPDMGKPSSAVLRTPGGWYDAGDYGKYMVNGGLSTATLLSLYERYGNLIPDRSLNIPESGNGVSDLLDEIRYELDWMQTLQDVDGGIYAKVSPLKFSGVAMPVDDRSQHYVIGKTTASALNFTAVMAQAARVYKNIDPEFSSRCLGMAEMAWEWARVHSEILYTQGEGSDTFKDVETGAYDDKKITDEFLWAKAELFITTENPDYKITENDLPEVFHFPDWFQVSSLALFSLSTHPNGLDCSVRNSVNSFLLKIADGILEEIEANAYRFNENVFRWGSNALTANTAMTLSYAHQIDRDRKYLSGSIEVMDFLFGKNPLSYSYVTGFGGKSPLYPHHRFMQADGIDAPMPGYLVGGPNQARQDSVEHGKKVVYPYKAAAKSYVDDVESWASNEISINGNAALVFALGFIEAELNSLE